jgi:DtxR family Mn-dependent transcriptional regulator
MLERVKSTLEKTVPVATFDDLLVDNFVTVEGDLVAFTAAGEKIARDITRRHRLAERLLVDVLEVKREAMDETACEFEHVISEDVTDAICTLLGHPRVCPHGSPIPEGPCCRTAAVNVEPIVLPLTGLGVGENGKVAYIVTQDHPHLHKLLSLGIVPGTDIRLHQKAPSYVIKVNETQIALDAGVASQIYVRRT